MKAFDAPLSTHRADDDVEATCALLRILLAAVDTMPLDVVRCIADLAPRDEWPTGAVFEQSAARRASLEEAEDGFSLRSMRRRRAKGVVGPAKRDAGEVVAQAPAGEGLTFPT